MKVQFERRLAAQVLDIIFAITVYTPFHLLSIFFWNQPATDISNGVISWLLFFAGMICASCIYLLKDRLFHGRGFGKMFLKIRVVKIDGRRCDFASSAIRNITLLIPILNLIEFVLALTDRQGLRLGDKMAKTQVVD